MNRYRSRIAATYRVNLQIPRLPRLAQVNSDLFIVEAGFLERDVRAVSPGTGAVGV